MTQVWRAGGRSGRPVCRAGRGVAGRSAGGGQLVASSGEGGRRPATVTVSSAENVIRCRVPGTKTTCDAAGPWTAAGG